MANRVIRDWTASETVDSLSPQAEIFFTRLIMKADDYGNYTANPRLLNAALFPLKGYEVSEIVKWRMECVKAKLITTYSVDDKDYIHIHNFGQSLRRMKATYPTYDGQARTNDGNFRTSDGQVTDKCGQMTAETKRNETEKETESESENTRDISWFKKNLNPVLLDQLPSEKKKILGRAIEEAFIHMAADPIRLARAAPSDCMRLLNTWLSNMKPEKLNGTAKIIDDKLKSDALIKAKFAAKAAGAGANTN